MKLSHEGKARFVFILGESELELIPEEIISHGSVISSSKDRKKKSSNILLDASFHHSAMKDLKDGDRRGRPDLAHFFLLLCLDSRLNKAGALKTIIHTRNDERILVNPETRLPPSYHRFVGLMESLFQNGTVPSKENPLLTVEKGWSLADVVQAEKCDRIIILESEGVEEDPIEFLNAEKSERTAIIIGGFPSGQFKTDLTKLKTERLSFGKDMLKVWTVTSEMLVAAQEVLKAP